MINYESKLHPLHWNPTDETVIEPVNLVDSRIKSGYWTTSLVGYDPVVVTVSEPLTFHVVKVDDVVTATLISKQPTFTVNPTTTQFLFSTLPSGDFAIGSSYGYSRDTFTNVIICVSSNPSVRTTSRLFMDSQSDPQELGIQALGASYANGTTYAIMNFSFSYSTD